LSDEFLPEEFASLEHERDVVQRPEGSVFGAVGSVLG